MEAIEQVGQFLRRNAYASVTYSQLDIVPSIAQGLVSRSQEVWDLPQAIHISDDEDTGRRVRT